MDGVGHSLDKACKESLDRKGRDWSTVVRPVAAWGVAGGHAASRTRAKPQAAAVAKEREEKGRGTIQALNSVSSVLQSTPFHGKKDPARNCRRSVFAFSGLCFYVHESLNSGGPGAASGRPEGL